MAKEQNKYKLWYLYTTFPHLQKKPSSIFSWLYVTNRQIGKNIR